jgi:hypothetical protein
VTWNINALEPENLHKNIRDLFNFKNEINPDIIVVGFQEMVELNATNILKDNIHHKDCKMWSQIILNNLKNISPDYGEVTSYDMVGIYGGVFALEHIRHKISKVDFDTVPTGFANKLGNKGAVILRIVFDGIVINFIIVHLPAHQEENE